MVKVYAAARAIGTLLAIVAAFVAIPNVDVGAALVILGIVAGVALTAETGPRTLLAAVALPAVGTALANVPAIGEQLGMIASNFALYAGGSAATYVALAVFNRVKGDWT